MASNLKILQINLAHSKAAADNLSKVVSDLQPDILLVQEPYYTTNNNLTGCSINDIIFAAKTRPLCAIIIRNTEIVPFPIKVERDRIIIIIETKNTKIKLVSTYCSPSSNLIDYLLALKNELETITCNNIILGGDLNAKGRLWGNEITDERGTELIEFMLTNNLATLNNSDSIPTFETANGKSWIDVTLTSLNILSEVVFWKVLTTESLSDHRYIYFSLFHTTQAPIKRLTKKGELNLIKMIHEDRWFKQISITQITSSFQLQIILNIFYDKLSAYRKKCIRNVKQKHKAHPWWTPELDITRKKVRALRRRYQRSKNPELKQIFKRAYYEFLQEYKIDITNAKENSWQNFCTDNTKQNIFGLPYKIAFEKMRKPLIIPPILKEDGTLTSNVIQSLTEIMKCLFQKDNIENDTPVQKELRISINRNIGHLHDHFFTLNEVTGIITKLKPRSAPGLDNITSNLLKCIFSSHPNFVLNIFNSALKYSYFPQQWKEAKLILLNKPNKPLENPRSYRPICLNSIFGKVLERLLNSRLYFFLYQNNLFHPKQYGFTHEKSTANALHQIRHTLEENRANDKHSVLISLDFQGAFDSVWHPIIFEYLREHKCPTNLYQLLLSFLQNRTNTYVSPVGVVTCPVEMGCPQGSPLSPLLWNILISKLLNKTFPLTVHIQAYADDTILIVSGSTRRALEDTANTCLKTIADWSTEHRLTLNYSKCNYLLFAVGRRITQTRPPTIRINNISLKILPTMRILGVIFDGNLTFLPHAEYLREKVIKHTVNLSTFSKIHWGINQQQQRDIYLRCIERYCVYGACAWWKTTNNSHLIRKITSIQRIPLLNITRAYRTTSNISLPILSNVLPLHITLEKETKQFTLFQAHKEIQCNNETFNRHNSDYKYDSWSQHPALKHKFDYALNISVPSNLHIYTDGSLKPGKVGAAYVVMSESEEIEKIEQFRLPPYATIYDAERIAFEQALIYIKNNKPHPLIITIYTDSLSLLQNIANIETKTKNIHSIKHLIQELKIIHKIQLVYVKAHAGNVGNELADKYAKLAYYQGKYISCSFSKQYIKKQLFNEAKQQWEQEWQVKGQGKELFTWISSVYKIPITFPPSHFLTQILTGHGQFPFYLFRFKIANNNKCFCGLDAINFAHYFTTCAWTLFFRNQLQQLQYNDFNESTKSAMLSNTKALQILERMMIFIQDEMNSC